MITFVAHIAHAGGGQTGPLTALTKLGSRAKLENSQTASPNNMGMEPIESPNRPFTEAKAFEHVSTSVKSRSAPVTGLADLLFGSGMPMDFNVRIDPTGLVRAPVFDDSDSPMSPTGQLRRVIENSAGVAELRAAMRREFGGPEGAFGAFMNWPTGG